MGEIGGRDNGLDVEYKGGELRNVAGSDWERDGFLRGFLFYFGRRVVVNSGDFFCQILNFQKPVGLSRPLSERINTY